jgi:hypothetical protein
VRRDLCHPRNRGNELSKVLPQIRMAIAAPEVPKELRFDGDRVRNVFSEQVRAHRPRRKVLTELSSKERSHVNDSHVYRVGECRRGEICL